MEYLAMRTDTFEKKVKELATATGLPTNELSMNIDPYGKKVGIHIHGDNAFTVAGNDLSVVYEKVLRIMRAYGPKMNRGVKSAKVAKSAEKAD